MATVDKTAADRIVAGNGYFSNDPRVLRIIEYTNAFDGRLAYGLEYKYNFGRYAGPDGTTPSHFIRNPRVFWTAAQSAKGGIK